MNFFVCGGTGYVGTRVVTTLIKNGHKVCCVRRTKSDISTLPTNNIRFCENEKESVKRCFEEEAFDWVINLACSYKQGNILYDDIIESNLEFPLMVINIAVKYKVKNYLTIGTGLPDDFNMYSFSKRMLADFGHFYCEQHNINFYNLELEMFYGPNEPVNRFLPSCIEKMYKGEEVQLTLGTQKRDVIYIDDVIAAIVLIIEKCKLNGYQAIPVGTGVSPTICDIIKYLHSILESSSILNFGAMPMRPGEPDCVADISILNSLGFQVGYQWKDGLKKMLEVEGKI